ncbi:MAG TPA: formylglycine-generating enzyme family protein [Candidatus Fraserbacteria bacterium]|nr:formylglycine-generating enzyme family protein [Candidatus Fraserbacteria bacterium]
MRLRMLKISAVGLALLGFSLIGVAQIQPSPQGPQITAIDFPNHITPDGQPVSGVVHFQAPEANVAQIKMKVLQALNADGQDISKNSDIQDASWDPGVKGLRQGEIPFNIATKIEQRVVIAATLIGSSGPGPSKEFSFDSFLQPQTPSEMVLIPAGSFQMGDSFNEGDVNERPVHTVTVSAFYMDKYEVTKGLWDDVANWAADHGYDIAADSGSGKAMDHPVQSITWYQAVKWANARSEKEGLTPAYYTDSSQTTVYRAGSLNVQTEGVKWSANGYRLPTEAEWEKAARGGATGHRFPWSYTDTINETRANYYGDTRYSYDEGPNGYNPTYATGGFPYTSPVGSFAPNGYGLYDMTGNVWEWVWDWFDPNYYSASPGTDPHGSASGSARVERGGSWHDTAGAGRVAYRSFDSPDAKSDDLGFRLVRTAP